MYEFTYHKPASLGDAASLLGNEDAKLVAGGMTLVPTTPSSASPNRPTLSISRQSAASRASRKKAVA